MPSIAAPKHMPLKDKLILGPIDKYQIHGRFPWKMILTIMIVTFSTAQVQIMVKSSSDQNRVESLNFYRMFVDADVWILLIISWIVGELQQWWILKIKEPL